MGFMYLGDVVSQTMGMFFAGLVGISGDDYSGLWALVAIKIVCILLSFSLLPMVSFHTYMKILIM